MTPRIGIVTGGGDCPGLNAVIRAVAKAAAKREWEAIGFFGGYEGMLEPPKYRVLNYQELGGLLTRGGTILGTANRGLFSAKVGHGEGRQLPRERIDGVKATMQKMGIRGLDRDLRRCGRRRGRDSDPGNPVHVRERVRKD